ncbi:MAG: hypothetical protein WCG27_08725 [Pseudomonadota bacterium]
MKEISIAIIALLMSVQSWASATVGQDVFISSTPLKKEIVVNQVSDFIATEGIGASIIVKKMVADYRAELRDDAVFMNDLEVAEALLQEIENK